MKENNKVSGQITQLANAITEATKMQVELSKQKVSAMQQHTDVQMIKLLSQENKDKFMNVWMAKRLADMGAADTAPSDTV